MLQASFYKQYGQQASFYKQYGNKSVLAIAVAVAYKECSFILYL